MIKYWAIVSIIVGSSVARAKAYTCIQFLNHEMQQDNGFSSTTKLISYLSSLYEHNIISEKELRAMIENIEQRDELVNVIASPEIRSAHRIHHEMMDAYLTLKDLDLKAIYQWVSEKLMVEGKVKAQKNSVTEETKSPYLNMKFYPVKGGQFEVRERSKKYLVNLTRDIEVMPTPVTQMMWAQEMGVNPAGYKDGPDSMVLEIKGQKIKLRPNAPVESVTWYAAAQFANYMSRKHGLPEVYDFSGLEVKDRTRFEDGTLDFTYESLKEHDVRVFGGNIYETEGFRLPTRAELRFLSSDRGRSNTDYFTGVDTSNLKDYAWFESNSNRRTQEVGEKLPYIVDGYAFYDLVGNVQQWTQDGVKFQDSGFGLNLSAGENPVGPLDGNNRALHGGSFTCGSNQITTFWPHDASPESHVNGIGFRLVRTLHSKK